MSLDCGARVKFVPSSLNSYLTLRELDVLRLMSSGATNQEIGQTLGISHETVRKHVTRVIDKLGARNRTHASIISNHADISGDG